MESDKMPDNLIIGTKLKWLLPCTNSAGDRKLYKVLRNDEAQTWDCKHNKFVVFENEKYLNYTIPLEYAGGDIYLIEVPLRAKDTTCVIVYYQEGREPDIYDKIYHIFGAEMPKDIPEKIRPMAPFTGEIPVSRTRSKVKQDIYSDSPH